MFSCLLPLLFFFHLPKKKSIGTEVFVAALVESSHGLSQRFMYLETNLDLKKYTESSAKYHESGPVHCVLSHKLFFSSEADSQPGIYSTGNYEGCNIYFVLSYSLITFLKLNFLNESEISE